MNFYTVIIGTEILNGRRQDKHFEFVKNELAKYGHELFASFIIKDDVELITRTYEMIKADKRSVMFSFGGIGSTPDDLTREIASKVFRNSPLITHEKFKEDVIKQFNEGAYPHRIHMADLPPNVELLFNPINNMSGFALDQRFFFVPGFPSMAHPMIQDAIKKYFSHANKKYRKTLLAKTSEETLISLMQQLPKSVELSSLPIFVDGKPNVELSLSGENEEEIQSYFELFKKELEKLKISYSLSQ
jgi:molybdopterin-biosynthesis enzyme MoeA-like protein